MHAGNFELAVMKKMKALILVFTVYFSVPLQAQQGDTTKIFRDRDSYGDLNSDAIKKGQFKGSIELPGLNVSLFIGGFIKATAFYDTKYNQKEEVLVPATFSAKNIDKGQFNIGARSSRLYFDARATTKKGTTVKAYIEMDYRGSPGITLRHAYLEMSDIKNRTILMGQYWSLAMDLSTIPESLVEPTMSGAAFARHGQFRYTRPINKKTSISISVEDPNNNDFAGVPFTALKNLPDLLSAFHINPSKTFHFSLSGLLRFSKLRNDSSGKSYHKKGYLISSALFIKDNKNKFGLNGVYGNAGAGYVMGSDASFSGYLSADQLELQNQYGGNIAFRHLWNEKFRSNIAYGILQASDIDTKSKTYLKGSQYFFINTFYKLNEYINMGVEWINASRKNNLGPRFINNRFQFGIQIF